MPTSDRAFAAESRNCGSSARARAVKTSIESLRASASRSSVCRGTGSGGTGYSCSPAMRRGTRLVTRKRSCGAACSRALRTGAALTRRSKLSRTTSASRERSSRASVSTVSSPGCSPTSRADAIAEPRRFGIDGRLQIDEERAVRQLLAQLHRRLDRHPGLPHAARAGQGQHGNVRVAQRGADRGDLETASHEPRHRARQPQVAAGSRRPERRVVAKDGALDLAQLGARIDAELVGECPARRLECRESLGLPARAVERQHVLRPQALTVRMLRNQLLELGHEAVVAAERELRVDPQLVCALPALAEDCALRLDRVGREVAQRARLARAPAPRSAVRTPAPPSLSRGRRGRPRRAGRSGAGRALPNRPSARSRCHGSRCARYRAPCAGRARTPAATWPGLAAGLLPRGSRSSARAGRPRWRAGAGTRRASAASAPRAAPAGQRFRPRRARAAGTSRVRPPHRS